MPALLRRFLPVLILLALVVALPFLLKSAYQLRVATLVFTAGLTAIGLNILMGQAGQVSLGHAGFGGIGAYAVAILPTHYGVHPLAAFLIGVTAAGLVAFVVGRPILRLRGHYLAVATLGMGILIAMVIQNQQALTGGPDGMQVPRMELFGWRVRGAETWYWICGAFLIAGAVLAVNLIDSPTGRALRAVHDSEVAARVLGIDVARAKLTAFTISAVYAATGGALLAFVNAFVTPDIAGFLHSVELVTMVVLGGLGSVVGAVVGAAILVVLPQVLTVFHEYEHLAIGLIMIGVMIFMRAGVVPTLIGLVRGRSA
ncbi:branched-chain amino acid ABC transporter permease [Prosthecomicrobium hirschii]|uniref:Branched-chain amino acid ABC transporter permease n=1 Tax=Prosthecodimorpha hirschii TaxID=665126 RepID=A0A0P6VNP6_9HYPH|nr:branched-chain amino acid ABC transporter permease [Prosthecomicrobium hirschii]KPL52884.1 branched-chain amino acid ABC transporter permease [Prosthecomicrobium hirschii]